MKKVQNILLWILFSVMLITSNNTTSLEVTQVEERSIFVFMESDLNSESRSILGNTSETRLNLLVTEMSLTKNSKRGRAVYNSTIEVSEDSFLVNGEINGTLSHLGKNTVNVYQTELYLPDYGINERARVHPTDTRTQESYSVIIDREFEIPFTYAELLLNEDYTLRESEDIGVSAFIGKSGSFSTVEVEDDTGNVIGTVFAFEITLRILFYDYDSHAFIGYHTTMDVGHGNNLPNLAINYLDNGPFEDRRPESSRDHKRSLGWLSLDTNETLGLDMYLSFYKLERTVMRVVLDRIKSHERPSDSLSLSSLETSQALDFDTFADELAAEFEMGGFEEDSFDEVEDAVVTQVLDEAEINDSDGLSSDDTDNSGINFSVFAVFAIFAVPIVNRRFHKKS